MKTDDRGLVSTRAMETGVAAFAFALGAVLIFDALRLGIAWADDGPRAGYFPFYIGVILCLSSLVTLVQGLVSRAGREAFVERGQARLVLSVLLPCIAYVVVVALVGVYVASAVFIGAFMVWQGRFKVHSAMAAGLGVTVALFLMFEVWFKVPLPKGPVEALLGL